MGMEAPLDTEIENGKIGELGGSVNKEELLETWSITHLVGKGIVEEMARDLPERLILGTFSSQRK